METRKRNIKLKKEVYKKEKGKQCNQYHTYEGTGAVSGGGGYKLCTNSLRTKFVNCTDAQ
jgi:hypothetical protein